MNTKENFYKEFAQEWIEAWNSHDLERIMSHYDENIDFNSPVIVRLKINAEGRITDKNLLKAYFAKSLETYPDLHFKLHYVLSGQNSVVLHYESINNSFSAECMQINDQGKVSLVRAHYCAK